MIEENDLKDNLKDDLKETIISNPKNNLNLEETINMDFSEVIQDEEILGKELLNNKLRYNYKGNYIKGGMGKVLFVYDKLMNRDIVLKELTKYSGNSKLRFVREARLTARLEHPSIIPIYEIGVIDEKIYYTMREIKGKTLSQAIRSAKTLENRLKLLPNFLNMCYALAYAHKKDIIHRDIKPANVMIGEFGETILLDWGLAKDLKEQDRLIDEDSSEDYKKTISGKIFGTPSYMSPEQAKGDIENIDKKSDIYSLGIVLYSILTGHSAYKGKSSRQILKKVINEDIIPFNNKDIPKELIAITEKAVKKNKLERYSSVSELAEDVNLYLSGKNVEVYHYTFLELIKKFYNKNKANKIISFLLAAISLITFFSFIFIYQSLEKEKKARFYANVSLLNEKHANKKSNYNFSISLLQKAKSLLDDKQNNAAQIYAVASLNYNPRKHNDNYVNQAKSILYESELSMKFKVDFMTKFNFYIRKAIIEKDNRIILADNKGKVYIWDIKDRKIKDSYNISNSLSYDLDISTDKKRVVTVNTDFCLSIWSLEDKKTLNKKCFDGAKRIYLSKFHNNDKDIITIGRERDLISFDSKTLKEKYRIKGLYNNMITYLGDLSKDKKYLVTADTDKHIILWDLVNKKIISSTTFKYDVLGITMYNKKILITTPEKIFLLNQNAEIIRSFQKDSSNSNIRVYNDKYLISIGNFLTIWNLETETKLSKIKIMDIGYDKLVLFPKDKNKIILLSSSGELKELTVILNQNHIINEKEAILDIDIAKNGKMFATSYQNKEVIVKDSKNSIIKKIYGGKIIKFSNNSRYLVSRFNKTDIKLYDFKLNKIKIIRLNYKKIIHRIIFNYDDSKILLGAANGYLIVYDIKSGISKLIKSVDLAVIAILSNKNFTAVAGLDKKIVLFDNNFNKTDILVNKSITEAIDSFDNNSKLLASGKDSNIYVWDLKKRKIVDIYRSLNDVWTHTVKISPDEKLFVAVGNDNNIRLWNLKEKNIIINIHIPSLSDSVPVFTPDSKNLIVIGGNRRYIIPVDKILSYKNLPKDITFYEDRSGLKLDGFILKVK